MNLRDIIRKTLREEIDIKTLNELRRRTYLIDKVVNDNLKQILPDDYSNNQEYINKVIENTLRDLHGEYFVYSEPSDEEWDEYKRFIITYIKENYTMDLKENINRIKTIMVEGKDSLISRNYSDQEYEDEYPKWGKTIIKILESEIDSYTEINNNKIIVLFNKGNLSQNLIKYDKLNERLWYDYSLLRNVEGYIPYTYLSRHFKYAVQDFFKKHFPDYGVREIMGGNLVSY